MPEPHVVAITPALLREVSGLDAAERATACAALNLHLAHHGVHGHIASVEGLERLPALTQLNLRRARARPPPLPRSQ